MIVRQLAGASAALVLAGCFLVTGQQVAAAGTWVTVKYEDAGSYPFSRGEAQFYPDVVNEQVRVCDRFNDGLTVSAQLRYQGAVQLEVTDRTGADIHCATQNLGIPEGTPVSLRVCVQNLGCTAWHDGVA